MIPLYWIAKPILRSIHLTPLIRSNACYAIVFARILPLFRVFYLWESHKRILNQKKIPQRTPPISPLIIYGIHQDLMIPRSPII